MADENAVRAVGTMLRFVRLVDLRLRQAFGGELTIGQLSILAEIEAGADMPSVLARRLPMDPPRVTRLADQLVEQGMLEREHDLEDRRRLRLILTPAGKVRLVEGREVLASAMDTLLEGVTDSVRRDLMSTLESVRPKLFDITPPQVEAGYRQTVSES